MRFFAGFVSGIVILALLWLLAIYGQIGNPTATSRWVYDAYMKKEAILKKTSGRRLLIVAGSNALFGIDSKILKRKYGRDCVNLGVNAGLLLPYILYRARRELARGDIVLLPLEYSMYVYDGEPNEQIIGFTYAFDPAFFSELGWRERIEMLWKTPLSRVLEGYLQTGRKAIDYGLYGAHHIDDNGDQKANSLKDIGKEERAALAAIKPERYGREYHKDAISWRYLEAFEKWARRNGICTIYTPPVFMDNPLYHNDAVERAFYENLPQEARKHGLRFVGNPYEFMYPKEWFFNTDYHLNAEARKRHTARLVKLLGDDLERYCPAPIRVHGGERE